jgi:hypothetical protein
VSYNACVHIHATVWVSFTHPAPIDTSAAKLIIFSKDDTNHHLTSDYPWAGGPELAQFQLWGLLPASSNFSYRSRITNKFAVIGEQYDALDRSLGPKDVIERITLDRWQVALCWA